MVVSLPDAGRRHASSSPIPAEACGDDARVGDAPTTASRPRTASADGPWAVAAAGALLATTTATALNADPGGRASGVRHVRVTLLSAQGGGDFFDLSEFGVHGTPVVRGAAAGRRPRRRRADADAHARPVGAADVLVPGDGRTTVKFKVTCAAVCAVTAKLTVDRPTAKQLGLGRT